MSSAHCFDHDGDGNDGSDGVNDDNNVGDGNDDGGVDDDNDGLVTVVVSFIS
ncbi:hypothetical protein DPMN_179305 [Dreissena polymorpha]|uniref:Uncharacterized protein n=1 Tax=Dreissena polymorpha TaxID=45954 RepID=A0A9D4EGX0_DREPO|nr:hypothetical protein DPMN_179305 [Dreissena polymorpha]